MCCKNLWTENHLPAEAKKLKKKLEEALSWRMLICIIILNKVFSQYIVDNAFFRLHMGKNLQGMFGIVPIDLMHAFESSLVPMLLKVLIEPLPDFSKFVLNGLAEKIFLSVHA